MATRASNNQADWREVVGHSLSRGLELIFSVILIIFWLFALLAIVSYHQTDPAINTVAAGPVQNWMGRMGAYFADAVFFVAGLCGILIMPWVFTQSRRLWHNQPLGKWQRALFFTILGIIMVTIGLTLVFDPASKGLPAGWGGIIGLFGHHILTGLLSAIPENYQFLSKIIVMLVLVPLGLVIIYRALGMEKSPFRNEDGQLAIPGQETLKSAFIREEGDGDVAIANNKVGTSRPAKEEKVGLVKKLGGTIGTALLPSGKGNNGDSAANGDDGVIDHDDLIVNPKPRPKVSKDTRPNPKIGDSTARPAQITASTAGQQGDFFGSFALPSIDLLSPPSANSGGQLDKAALAANAKLLEQILADFNVQGDITQVSPGPVVTRYELLPAPGIKAQRVINLADDIARNMSAQSARVATIPCRKELGIELPNRERDGVVLHEMVASEIFAHNKGTLPIILGKNISGKPVVVDLSPMPHLLIAGTTGSGKSVGLNCMILSLLYRMTPDQCRLIMIDPKMLELSIYDDIPHLLSPVVTEPTKAVRALKWAVEQMEERYRMMSELKVRSLANFNEKVRSAKAKGKALGEKVQTGWDPVSGQPQYEQKQLDYEPMPLIVIVVDELADLMMTAGKEVEFLIQRLAQKARAAGIHLIMATQRPSVDVITGVIKANLPTRISFHVTSKIDSRTILGEQGAEQLLGKGDMLYMSGGKQLERVHGPFVSDDEVRKVADHWREQGAPDYIEAVTEEPEDGGFALDGADLSDNPEDQLYRKACQLVFEAQKVSTSWLQRQLRIGYNRAADLVDRMEADGYISSADHVGRRTVLRDQNGEPI